jgi:hypothetical protein
MTRCHFARYLLQFFARYLHHLTGLDSLESESRLATRRTKPLNRSGSTHRSHTHVRCANIMQCRTYVAKTLAFILQNDKLSFGVYGPRS